MTVNIHTGFVKVFFCRFHFNISEEIKALVQVRIFIIIPFATSKHQALVSCLCFVRNDRISFVNESKYSHGVFSQFSFFKLNF